MVSPVLATPIGLALPEPDKAVKKFNLLPPEVASRIRMKRIQERTIVAAVAVLVLLLGFGGWKFYNVHKTQNNVDDLQANITALNAQVPQVRPGGGGQQRLHRRSDPTGLGPRTPPSTGRWCWATSSPSPRPTAKVQIVQRCHPGRAGSALHRPRRPSAGSTSATAATSTTSAAIGTVAAQRHRSGTEPVHLRGMDQRRLRLPALRQPPAGSHDGQPGLDASRSPSTSPSPPMPASTRMRA